MSMQIILAPMEGVVDPVIRKIYSKIGGFDRFVTEFVRVTDRLLPDHVFFKYSPELRHGGRTAEGIPVFVQLLGGQPQPLAWNADRAVQLGAPGIDLNFGCPAKTVNRHDGGAALLQNPTRLYDVISAVKTSVQDRVPVTAKVRLGFMDKSLVNEIASAVAEAGPASLIVHARTKIEGYRPPAHWEFIAKMKEVIAGRVPVIANGDIWCVADYRRCQEISKCEDVALGRGAMAKPDLALAIKNSTLANRYDEMNFGDLQSNWFPNFVEWSEAEKGQTFALSRAKQWLKLMSREYSEAGERFEQIKRCQQLQDLKRELRLYEMPARVTVSV